MSTASPVPETWELTGDDAWQTLKVIGRRQLLVDGFQRMRSADGFSHVRSTAFLVSLLLVQATIGVVGLATVLGDTRFSLAVVKTIQSVAPGPAGQILTGAVMQASEVGHTKRYLGLVLGLLGSLVTGTTVMGQLERGLNRIYGVEQDRPTLAKYSRAFVLAITSGVLIGAAFLAVAFGSAIGESLNNDGVSLMWNILRWPVAIAALIAAVALLFRKSPRRHQPSWSWLAFGSAVSIVLWMVVNIGMGLVFRLSTSFGDTYGPLAGLLALQLWAMFSCMALLFGGAIAAQLEAVRAGAPEPQDEERVEEEDRAAENDPEPDDVGPQPDRPTTAFTPV